MKPLTTKQFIWSIITSGLGVTLWLHSVVWYCGLAADNLEFHFHEP